MRNQHLEKHMSNKPLVSIVIPVFNAQDYIASCLKSVIKQSYRSIEIIVVNDGSTDKSESIISNFASIDDRINYFKQTNMGVSAARNTGIAESRGKYICFVDADDSINSFYIESLLNMAITTGADIVTTPKKFTNLKEDEYLNQEIKTTECTLYNREAAIIALYNGNLEKGSNGAQLFRKNLLTQNKLL